MNDLPGKHSPPSVLIPLVSINPKVQTHFNVSVSHSEFVVEQTSSLTQSFPSSTSAISVKNIIYMS